MVDTGTPIAAHRRMMRFVLGAALGSSAATLVACLPGSHCSEGYDDRITTTYACDGNVRVGHSTSCGNTWDQAPVDCTKAQKVCVATVADCVTPCTADAQCTSFEYCRPLARDAGGTGGYCTARIFKSGICTDDPTHCEPGTTCMPAPLSVRDAAVNADADAKTAPGDDGGTHIVMTCQ